MDNTSNQGMSGKAENNDPVCAGNEVYSVYVDWSWKMDTVPKVYTGKVARIVKNREGRSIYRIEIGYPDAQQETYLLEESELANHNIFLDMEEAKKRQREVVLSKIEWHKGAIRKLQSFLDDEGENQNASE